MNDMPEWFAVVAVVTLVFFALMLFVVLVLLFRPWLRAAMNGSRVSLPDIVAMRLRGNPPMLLVDAFFAIRHAGMAVSISDVEAVYIDNKNRISTSDELVELVKQREHAGEPETSPVMRNTIFNQRYPYRIPRSMRVVILVGLLILAAGSLGILGDSFVVNSDFQRVIPSCLFVAALLISILLPHKNRYIVFTNDELSIPSLFIKSKQTRISFEAITDIQEKADANSDIMNAAKSIYITMENTRRRIRIIQQFFERDGYESFASCLHQRINADSSLKCTTTFYQRDDS